MPEINKVKNTFLCPYHSGFQSEIEELCRRCDEFKDQENKEGRTIEDIRSQCYRLREGCMEARKEELGKIYEKLDSVPKTSTLITIFSIVITVVGLLAGIWLGSHEKDISALKQIDTETRDQINARFRESKEERKEMTRKIDQTHEAVVELKTLIKKNNNNK